MKHECDNVAAEIVYRGLHVTWFRSADWETGWYLRNVHGGCEADDQIIPILFCPWCGVKLEHP